MSVREALAIAKQLGDDDDDDNGMIDACHQSPKKGHSLEGPVLCINHFVEGARLTDLRTGPVRLHKTQPMDHHDGPDFMHRQQAASLKGLRDVRRASSPRGFATASFPRRHCDPSVRARTRRSVEKDVTRAAKRRAKADREAAKLDDLPRPIVDAPAALIVKRAMDRKVVKDAQRQANMLSRLKQGARAPLGVAVAEALRTTKDAADAEFRQSRGRKPRQLGLSTPGLPLTTRDLVKSQAAELEAQKERERLEAAKRKRMLEMMEE